MLLCIKTRHVGECLTHHAASGVVLGGLRDRDEGEPVLALQAFELDAARLIFLDETWAKTNMTRLRGRARRGARLIDKTPHGHWKTTTLIAALDAEGVHAVLVLDGAGWHVLKALCVPASMTLLFLPQYSPELMPGGTGVGVDATASPEQPCVRRRGRDRRGDRVELEHADPRPPSIHHRHRMDHA